MLIPRKASEKMCPANSLSGTLSGLRPQNEGQWGTLHEIVLALQSLQPVTAITRQRVMNSDPTLKQQTQRLDSVNRILKQFEAVPVIKPPTPVKDSRIRLTWVRTKGSANLELSAALVAVKLAEEGRIHSLRQCSKCAKWLFAKFAHSRFCSEDCKNNFYREDPDEKKRRREWAKNNYWLHKNKNVK